MELDPVPVVNMYFFNVLSVEEIEALLFILLLPAKHRLNEICKPLCTVPSRWRFSKGGSIKHSIYGCVVHSHDNSNRNSYWVS